MRRSAGLAAVITVSLASWISCVSLPGQAARSEENAVDRPARSATPAAEAARFIEHYHAIRLTPEQERIKQDALESIPAPCCNQFSMATCCCPCNLAKSVWGLTHHLIAERRYDASAVRQAVLDWLASSNPGGYSGDACFTGGCQRPFSQNGCGGMDERHIVS
jgi:hypothetical protein